jgi:hypothetical protein
LLVLLAAFPSRGFLKGKIFAEIVLFPIADPFSGRFPALVLSIFVVKLAVQTAMQIPAAMGTNVGSARFSGAFNWFAASMTEPHNLCSSPNSLI